MVPVLAARAATVRVIAGVGVVHTVLVPPEPPGNELQMLNEAVVPTGDEEKAAGTATYANGLGAVQGYAAERSECDRRCPSAGAVVKLSVRRQGQHGGRCPDSSR